MPRLPRIAPGGQAYHVFNHANGKQKLFRKDADYLDFYDVLTQAQAVRPMRLLAWCLLPDQWHFVVWPHKAGDLSRYFGYIALTHATRWQISRDTVGAGHVYQSRFKNFMVQSDGHLAEVIRFVESSALRTGLVDRAQDWQWSSLHARLNGPPPIRKLLTDWPIAVPGNWTKAVNRPQSEAELAPIQTALQRSRPLGTEAWIRSVVNKYDLQSTMRPRGRQKGWRKVNAK